MSSNVKVKVGDLICYLTEASNCYIYGIILEVGDDDLFTAYWLDWQKPGRHGIGDFDGAKQFKVCHYEI